MRDTGSAARGALAAVVALAVLAGAAAAADMPGALRAKVIWAHGGRAYVASNDPLPLQTGDLLTFYDGKKVAASGKVSEVLDGTLAIARMTSGSLDGFKKLDRLRVHSERPRLRPVDILRIGIPSRSNLLFPCATPSVKSPLPRAGYRGEAMSVRSFLLARDTGDPATAHWPDTLLVRLFDEATDQEIAMERGELDLAVFWPGELSTHMREDPRWREFSYGARPRTVLVATLSRESEGGFVPADTSALLSLGEEVFRGDLVPWDPASGKVLSMSARGIGRAGTPHRFEVDRSVPGWQSIERALRRLNPTSSSSVGGYPVRVSLLGAQANPPDPAGLSFAIRCPIVSAPSLRPYVQALGPDALANMVDCAIARGGP